MGRMRSAGRADSIGQAPTLGIGLLCCLLLAQPASASIVFSSAYNIENFGEVTETIFSTEFEVDTPWILDEVRIEVTHRYASELELSLSGPEGEFHLLRKNGARTRVGAGTGTVDGVEPYTLIESGAPLGSVSDWDFTGYKPGGTYDALEWPRGALSPGVSSIPSEGLVRRSDGALTRPGTREATV